MRFVIGYRLNIFQARAAQASGDGTTVRAGGRRARYAHGFDERVNFGEVRTSPPLDGDTPSWQSSSLRASFAAAPMRSSDSSISINTGRTSATAGINGTGAHADAPLAEGFDLRQPAAKVHRSRSTATFHVCVTSITAGTSRDWDAAAPPLSSRLLNFSYNMRSCAACWSIRISASSGSISMYVLKVYQARDMRT